MAFTVTPTSGASPYIIQANIDQSYLVNGVDYSAAIMSSVGVGSCPTLGTTSPMPDSLLMQVVTGIAVNSGWSTVPSGSCRTWTLTITNNSDNSIIAQSSVSVNNV